jgi:hypothetical protein
MKKIAWLLIVVTFISCTKDENLTPFAREDLSDEELEVLRYFKEIALGFEFGDASKITRKWQNDMNVYVGGQPTMEMLSELEMIITEINQLCSDGFRINIVTDSTESNHYLFLGPYTSFYDIYPGPGDQVDSNWGLFYVYWNADQNLFRAITYVDNIRPNLTEQKHLLREEITQSLGLARDSFRYDDSIFQQNWTIVTDYMDIDREMIRILYHPLMVSGLNEREVESVIIEILRENV